MTVLVELWVLLTRGVAVWAWALGCAFTAGGPARIGGPSWATIARETS